MAEENIEPETAKEAPAKVEAETEGGEAAVKEKAEELEKAEE